MSVGRALLRGDVRDGAAVRVGAEHGDPAVIYDQRDGTRQERAT